MIVLQRRENRRCIEEEGFLHVDRERERKGVEQATGQISFVLWLRLKTLASPFFASSTSSFSLFSSFSRSTMETANGRETNAEQPSLTVKTDFPSHAAATAAAATGVPVDGTKVIDGKDITVLDDAKDKSAEKKKGGGGGGFANFLYDSRRKTILGRDSLNWAKLSAFYTAFYFVQGCFFVILLYVFALLVDRHVPTYYNTESTMSVRTPQPVVGMGFRPQPVIDDNIIRVSDNPREQTRIASSLRLYRDVFLIQRADAKTENCTDKDPASDLPVGYACSFNWFHIVNNQEHPCSDNNMYGFKKEQPCVLVKVNKIYGWVPPPGPLPVNIQQLRGISSNKSVAEPDVYVTCGGTNAADSDALKNVTYYSLDKPSGSSKYGAIPNHYFPYRNAKDHVQPFVLVQFKDLPYNQLIGVTCRIWYPGVEHETRYMRGMVNFQLYRSHSQRGVELEEL